MELKYFIAADGSVRAMRSNRTFMELKLQIWSSSHS